MNEQLHNQREEGPRVINTLKLDDHVLDREGSMFIFIEFLKWLRS
jgi:hypothetical protein